MVMGVPPCLQGERRAMPPHPKAAQNAGEASRTVYAHVNDYVRRRLFATERSGDLTTKRRSLLCTGVTISSTMAELNHRANAESAVSIWENIQRCWELVRKTTSRDDGRSDFRRS
jgi:hypothetical protein